MSRTRSLLLYGALLCVAAGSTVAFRTRSLRLESPIPSADNPGPRGAKALFTYLAETGVRPGLLVRSYHELPADASVVVALEPTRRLIGASEWDAILEWTRRGGTYVYAVPRRARSQFVERELGLRWLFGPRPTPLSFSEELDRGVRGLSSGDEHERDPSGAEAAPFIPAALLSRVWALRVSADDGLETSLPSSLPLAGAGEAAFVLSLPFGEGELVVLAGADLAENRRLSLADNLRFWANLTLRGPLYFDEYHHRDDGSAKGLARIIGPPLLHLFFFGAALALARGRRLGVARPLMTSRRRSQSEYVEQLARIYAAANLERELCEELHRTLRQGLFERFGISPRLDDPEAARRLCARTGIAEETFLALVREKDSVVARGPSAKDYASLSERFARFERGIGL